MLINHNSAYLMLHRPFFLHGGVQGKGMTTGWSLHVNGSDSQPEREREVEREVEREAATKAPSPNGLRVSEPAACWELIAELAGVALPRLEERPPSLRLLTCGRPARPRSASGADRTTDAGSGFLI